MVWFGCVHKVLSFHVHLFALLKVSGFVLQCQQNPTAAPAEFVSWIWLAGARFMSDSMYLEDYPNLTGQLALKVAYVIRGSILSGAGNPPQKLLKPRIEPPAL
jgi:hypothetical protein